MRQDDEQPTGLVEVWSLRGVGAGDDPRTRDRERVYDFIRMHEALVEDEPISLRAIERGLEMAPDDVLRHLAALVDAERVEFVAAGWHRERAKMAAAAAHNGR